MQRETDPPGEEKQQRRRRPHPTVNLVTEKIRAHLQGNKKNNKTNIPLFALSVDVALSLAQTDPPTHLPQLAARHYSADTHLTQLATTQYSANSPSESKTNNVHRILSKMRKRRRTLSINVLGSVVAFEAISTFFSSLNFLRTWPSQAHPRHRVIPRR